MPQSSTGGSSVVESIFVLICGGRSGEAHVIKICFYMPRSGRVLVSAGIRDRYPWPTNLRISISKIEKKNRSLIRLINRSEFDRN